MTVGHIVELIVRNNSETVLQRLSRLGVSSSTESLEDDLMAVLEDMTNVRREEFLTEILDVPVNLNGQYAEELLTLHAETGNRNLLENHFKSSVKANTGFADRFGFLKSPFTVDLRLIALGVGIFTLTILSIYLIRRL